MGWGLRVLVTFAQIVPLILLLPNKTAQHVSPQAGDIAHRPYIITSGPWCHFTLTWHSSGDFGLNSPLP